MFTSGTGIVKWFNVDKGLGMITPDDGSVGLSVLSGTIISDGVTTLNEGQRVWYVVGSGPKGMQALEVSLASSMIGECKAALSWWLVRERSLA